jgi:hypothetical protein
VTSSVFLGSLLALPVLGLAVGGWTLPSPRNIFALIGVSAASGAVVLVAEMLVLTWAAVPWSATLLLLPALLLLFPKNGMHALRRAPGVERASASDVALLVLTLGAVLYAAATARATGGDLLLFWGAKGERFGLTRSIDVGFLRDPLHFLMHPTYPPLVPLIYAWGCMAAGRLSWSAVVWTMPLFLFLTVCVFLGFAEPFVGRRSATMFGAVLAAMLGLVMISVPVAGNAEPVLLYFEATSLVTLLFAPPDERACLAAGIGLAGTVMTKLEGTFFALFVVFAHLAFGRSRGLKNLSFLAGPPLVMLAAWFSFCRAHGVADVYELPTMAAAASLPAILSEVGRQGSFGVAYAPWIAVLAVGIGGRWSRETSMAVTVALGFMGTMIWIYLGARQDPQLLVLWSAGRLLMTPLLCCFLGAVAAHRAPTFGSSRRLAA